VVILNNVKANAPRGAKLPLIDAVVDESATSSFPIVLDVEMLTFASGRERTRSQWQNLLEKAGFRLASATALGGLSRLVGAVVA